MPTVPNLEPHCGSWMAVDRETGKAVFETWNRSTAEKINQDRYQVLTAAQYLGRFNTAVKRAGGVEPTREQLRAEGLIT